MGDVNRTEEIIWAAGLLEGEGSFLLQTGTYYLKVQVQMTDLDVLESIQRIFGGNIHPITKRREHWKDAWVLNISGSTAYTCMVEIRPYMHSRRTKQIDLALSARKEYEENKVINAEIKNSLKKKIVEEYINGKGSIRFLAKKHGVGRGAIHNWILELKK